LGKLVGAIGLKEGCFLNGRGKEELYKGITGKKQEGKEGKDLGECSYQQALIRAMLEKPDHGISPGPFFPYIGHHFSPTVHSLQS
jgi:hypothetical protein